MALNLTMPEKNDLKPRITVFGVGGAGGNAVDNMIDQKLEGAEFVVANTDAQALQLSKATNKIQMGLKVTEGLGAGARPSVGAAAAEESIETIVDHLAGSHMCFITAGMGGGTGTGAAPIVARAARELGVLTVGVVTKPFQFEGNRRMNQAEEGIAELQKVVDTLIIIPNQNLFLLANEQTTFTEAFEMADDVLYQGVKGVTDLMVKPGVINLDFADVRSVMDEMGKAMMGTGEASGESRAKQAAAKAIANPLLDEISLKGAKGVLINITGGSDLTLFEADEAANVIRQEVDPDANIIYGTTHDDTLDGAMRVSIVATGIDVEEGRIENVDFDSHGDAEENTTLIQTAPKASVYIADIASQEIEQPVSTTPVAQESVETGPLFQRPKVEAAAHVYDNTHAQPIDQATGTDSLRPVSASYQPHEQSTQPTNETLARLKAAVKQVPHSQSELEVQQTYREEAHAQETHSVLGSGFVGALISKMTGGHNAGERETEHYQKPRPSGSIYSEPTNVTEEEQDPSDIPAFLRRQAN